MRIPTLEQIEIAGEVLMTWGFWILIYGAITMCIGLIIIGIVSLCSNKSIIKIVK